MLLCLLVSKYSLKFQVYGLLDSSFDISMNILIFEPGELGHQPTYLALFVTAFHELGHKVYVLSGIDLSSKKVLLESSFPLPPFTGFIGKPPFGKRQYVKGWWLFARKHIDRVKKDLPQDFIVFFPYLDFFIDNYLHSFELDRIFPYPWTGLYMNPKNHRVKYSFSQWRYGPFEPNHLLLSKNCKGIGCLDEMAIDWLQQKAKKRVIHIPDVIDDSVNKVPFTKASEMDQIIKDKKRILLIGSLEKRKGIMFLFDLLERGLLGDFALVMIGKLGKTGFTEGDLTKLRDYERAPSTNHFFHFERVPTEADFNDFIKLSDILYASYKDFPYSSNMPGKSAYLEKPIVVSNGGYMEFIVKKYNLGLSIDYGNIQQLRDALISLPRKDESDFAGYRKDHSLLRFQDQTQ